MLSPESLNYVKQQLLQGMNKEMIKNDLLTRGWTEADINEAITQAQSDQPVPVPSPVHNQNIAAPTPIASASYNHALAWLAGIIVIIILGLGGLYIYPRVFTKSQLAGNQTQAEALSPLLNPSVFVGSYDDYKIYVPKNWQLKEGGNTDFQTTDFYDPKGQFDSDEPLCQVVIQRGGTDYNSIDEVVAKEKEQLQQKANFSVTQEYNKTLGKNQFHVLEGTMTAANGGVLSLQYWQTINNSIFYSAGYLCDKKELQANQEALNAAISTFTIVPNQNTPSPSPTPSTESSTTTISLEQTPYVSNQTGIQINFPKGWVTKQESKFEVLATATDSDPDPAAAMQVGLSGNDSDIDAYSQYIVKTLSPSDPTFKLLSKVALHLNIGEQSAYQLNFSATVDSEKVILSQVLVYYPNNVYILQMTASQNNWDSYYKNLFDASIKTFKPLNSSKIQTQ